MTGRPTPDRGHDVYVHLTDGPVAKTHGLHEQVNVDMDSDGQFVGVEILGATSVDVDGIRLAGLPRTSDEGEIRGLAKRLAVPREFLDLMDTIPGACRFHGDDFDFLGREADGRPRCDSCKQPWLLRRARAAVLRGAS